MGQAQPESGWSLRWTNRLLSPRRVGAGWGGFQDGQVVLSCPPRDLRSPPSPGQDACRDKKSLGGLGTSVGNAKVPHREVPRDGRRPALRHLYITPAAPKALSKQPPAKPPAALHPAEAAHLGGCSPPAWSWGSLVAQEAERLCIAPLPRLWAAVLASVHAMSCTCDTQLLPHPPRTWVGQVLGCCDSQTWI